MSKMTKALHKARKDRDYQSKFLTPSSVNRSKPIRSMREGSAKGSAFTWILVIGILAVLIIAFNIKKGKDAVPLTEIFPDEEVYPIDVEYEFVESDGTVKKIIDTKPAEVKKAVAVKTEEVKKEIQAAAETKKAVVNREQKADVVNALSGVNFTIQVASFKNQNSAKDKQKEMNAKGYQSFIGSRDLGEKGIWYRVYVGRFDVRSDAESYLTKVKADYPDSFIITPKK